MSKLSEIRGWGKSVNPDLPLEGQRNVTLLEYTSITLTKFGMVLVSTLASFGNVFLYECYYGSAGVTSESVANIAAVQTTITTILGYVIGALTASVAFKWKSKIGRYRQWYLICLVPTMLITILSYYVPAFNEGGLVTFKYVLAILNCIVSGFYGLGNNITQVISPNHEEKKFIVILQQIAYYLGYGGAYIYMLVFEKISDNTRMRYLSLAVVGALITAAGSLMMSLFCKERIELSYKKEKLTKSVIGLFRYRNYVAYQLISWVGNFAMIGVMIQYLAAIVVGSGKAAAFALPSAAGTAVGVFICTAVSKKFSPVQLMKFVGVYSVFGAVLTFTFVYFFGFGPAYYIGYFIFGTSLGFMELSGNQFAVEFNDYLEWQTGERLEAVQGVIPGWINSALGYVKNMLIPFMLVWIGYETSQTDNLLETMKASPKYDSACLWLLAFALFGYALSCLLKMLILQFMYDVDGEKKKQMYIDLGKMREQRHKENLSAANEAETVK